MDRELENRLRSAIEWAEQGEPLVRITILDAKRLLYRMKRENVKPEPLVYHKVRHG